MRIFTSENSNQIGGMATYTRLLKNGATDNTFEYTIQNNDVLYADDDINGKKVPDFLNGFILFRFLKLLIAIFVVRRIVKKWRNELVVINGLLLWLFLIPKKTFKRNKVVWVQHSNANDIVNSKLWVLVKKKKIKLLDKVIAFSEEDKIIISKRFKHAFVTSQLLPVVETKLKANETKTGHYWVGRISYNNKNIGKLFELAKNNPKEKFKVIGSISNNELKRFENDIAEHTNVEYIGHKSNDEVMKHLCNAKSLIITSHKEGFPYVFLEASKLNIPTFATNCFAFWNKLISNKSINDIECFPKNTVNKFVETNNGKKYLQELTAEKEVQYLTSTMHFNQKLNDYKKMKNTNNILICNQGKASSENIINSKDIGLSKSRNVLLENENSPIIVVCDDDTIHKKDSEQMIRKYYAKLRKADVIIFKVDTTSGDEFGLGKKIRKVKRKDLLSINSSMITLKSAIKSNVSFDTNFGLGSGKIPAGEECVFVDDLRNNGAKIYYVPEVFATIDFDMSKDYNNSPNSLGAVLYRTRGRIKTFFMIKIVAILFKGRYKMGSFKLHGVLKKSIKDYKKILRSQKRDKKNKV